MVSAMKQNLGELTHADGRVVDKVVMRRLIKPKMHRYQYVDGKASFHHVINA
jgi:hypothetical protein